MKWFVSSLLLILLITGVNARVWNVNVDCLSDTITNGDSENIDVAFAYASAGDVIKIDSGVYYYSVQNTIDTTSWYFLKIVDDDIRIEGSGDVIIDCENQSFALYGAYADSIYIEGITFRNCYDWSEGAVNQYGVAFDLYSGDSWTIKNNIFYNNTVEDSLAVGQEIRGGLIYVGRWSIFENNVFDSNAIYDYGYGDTITGFIYCDYQVDFIGNVFKNNIIENRSEIQKSINGIVYYKRAFSSSYWFDNAFYDNIALNHNAMSGAVAFVYQENYQGLTDKLYGDSNIALNNYYFDEFFHNSDDTDVLLIPSLNKVNWLAIDIYANPEKDFKLLWLAIDLYDLFPYIQEILEKTEQRNYLNHTLIRRRFR